MKMKKIKVLLIFMLSVVSINAQHAKPSFSFNKEVHDFGTIEEEKGNVSFKFEFTNVGGQPIVIHNVQASCGCTSPEWTKMPVPPGGKGYVNVTFNPVRRPGPFNKTITVSSNSDKPSIILRITGKVAPKPPSVEEEFPRDMDGLRLKASHLSFTRVNPGKVKIEELEVYNSTGDKLEVKFKNVPAHIQIKMVPEVIGAKSKGKIVATFNGEKIKDWGFVSSHLYLNVGKPGSEVFTNTTAKLNYNNRLTISATIEEDFASLSEEELAKAPVASFKDKVFNFGTIKQGDVVSHSFVLSNNGKSNLVIRKVKASCGCTAVKPAKNVLTPGESTEIEAKFDSRGKSNRQNKSITIITNDPKNSTVLLRVSGNVVVD